LQGTKAKPRTGMTPIGVCVYVACVSRTRSLEMQGVESHGVVVGCECEDDFTLTCVGFALLLVSPSPVTPSPVFLLAHPFY